MPIDEEEKEDKYTIEISMKEKITAVVKKDKDISQTT